MLRRAILTGAVGLAIAAANVPHDADARPIRIDRSLSSLDDTGLANDGFVETAIRAGEETVNGTIEVPFSINYFGVVYDRIFINENGVISFGAPFAGTPGDDLFNAGIPLIAAFFADADMTATRFVAPNGALADGGVGLGYTNGTNMLVNMSSSYAGSSVDSTGVAPSNELQVAFFGSTLSTNFRLELNYSQMDWESANADGGTGGLGGIAPRVGFSNGSGLVHEIAGSGVNGVLLGNVNSTICADHPLSVACNDYFFNFIDGMPYQNGVALFPAKVPEPPVWALLLVGLALPGLRRRSESRQGRRGN